MSFNKFITKVLSQLMGDAIQKQLAQSKTFQDFALRTHHHVSKGQNALKDPRAQQALLEEARKAAASLRSSNPGSSFASKFQKFTKALGEEVGKDLKR